MRSFTIRIIITTLYCVVIIVITSLMFIKYVESLLFDFSMYLRIRNVIVVQHTIHTFTNILYAV